MERRAAIKLITLAALSPKLNALEAAVVCPMDKAQSASQSSEYKLQFFTDEENALLDQLMEIIIPADNHSPGAHAAKTSLFADLMVATSEDVIKNQWRQGLKLIREEVKSSSLAEALKKAATNESNPTTELERFFAPLKSMTVNGYYTSKIGIEQDLEYQGNTYIPEFPGCTHPEHSG